VFPRSGRGPRLRRPAGRLADTALGPDPRDNVVRVTDAVQEPPVQQTLETEPERRLHMEGLDNVRDVGGLPLRDGGRTRFGELLRPARSTATAPPPSPTPASRPSP
jgi:Tyrosine phosphatase family